MDKQQWMWAATALARLLVGALAGKLAWDATTQASMTVMIAEAGIALAGVVVSIYTSVKARTTLLNTPPPK